MQASTERLMKDLHAVVMDTEELLKATAGQGGERVEKVRARAEESLRNARSRVAAAANEVRENPWTAVGVAAGVGLIAGILLSRK